MLSMGCFVSKVGREDKSFGGDKEEVLDDEEDDDDELDEEDVDEDVSDSESEVSESEGGVVAFRFKDGNTVGSRIDGPGIGDEEL